MNDFLANLVERSLAPRPAVQPRLISLFEPLSAEAPAIFPHDDQPQPPAIEKQREAIPDGASQLESHWRTSPERTVVAETIQAPPTLHAEEPRRERLEAQPSIPARSKEADVTGVRAESDTDHKPAAPPKTVQQCIERVSLTWKRSGNRPPNACLRSREYVRYVSLR